MRGINRLLATGLLSVAVSPFCFAGGAPTIGGAADITANITGGIVNAGGGASGFQGTVKQAVASVLDGNIGGKVITTVNLTGGIVNVGGGASGAKITSCQSVGTVGSDCGSN